MGKDLAAFLKNKHSGMVWLPKTTNRVCLGTTTGEEICSLTVQRPRGETYYLRSAKRTPIQDFFLKKGAQMVLWETPKCSNC